MRKGLGYFLRSLRILGVSGLVLSLTLLILLTESEDIESWKVLRLYWLFASYGMYVSGLFVGMSSYFLSGTKPGQRCSLGVMLFFAGGAVHSVGVQTLMFGDFSPLSLLGVPVMFAGCIVCLIYIVRIKKPQGRVGAAEKKAEAAR